MSANRIINKGLGWLESAAGLGSGRKPWPLEPIFVIGAPRCGSTLIMQVVTDAFRFGYLSNAHCRWFGWPSAAERISRLQDRKKPSTYESRHGRTVGDFEPAECGAWWYRFFRRDPAYVTGKDVSRHGMRAFRRSMVAMTKAFGEPLIFKNLYAGLRIEPIVENVPGALFVVVERDLVDNAQSVLLARYDACGNYESWWSVPPPNVDELMRLPPVPQVVEQIRSIYGLIEHDLERLGMRDRTFHLRYDEFCADVPGCLEGFDGFMKEHGVAVERRFDVPDTFRVSRDRKIPDAMYRELVEYVDVTKGNGRMRSQGGERRDGA